MLALAIISTVMLAILILGFFGTIVVDGDNLFLGFTLMIMLGFVITTIWILYAR